MLGWLAGWVQARESEHIFRVRYLITQGMGTDCQSSHLEKTLWAAGAKDRVKESDTLRRAGWGEEKRRGLGRVWISFEEASTDSPLCLSKKELSGTKPMWGSGLFPTGRQLSLFTITQINPVFTALASGLTYWHLPLGFPEMMEWKERQALLETPPPKQRS